MRWALLVGAIGVCASCHLVVSFDEGVPAPDLAQPIVPSEDCESGSDEDGDGLVDCADPDCQVDHECLLPAPSGFSLTLVANGTEPTCPDQSAPTSLIGSGVPTCDASGCTCGDPTGTCAVNATLFTSACQGGPSNGVTMVPGACYSAGGTGTSGLFTASSASVACMAKGVASVSAPAVPGTLSLCAPPAPSGGCEAGRICMKRAPAPFATVCALATGAQACPTDRPRRQVLGTAFDDQRTCACDCSGGSSCALLQVELLSAPSCGGTAEPALADGKCKVFGATASSLRIAQSGAPGPCKPTAAVVGPLSATGPSTLCCP